MNQIALETSNGEIISYSNSAKAPSFSSVFRDFSYQKSESMWGYLGKMALITRHFLNAASRNLYIVALAGKNFPAAAKEFTTRMKLLSIVGVPFSIGDLNSATRKIWNSLFLNDKEEFALNSLSFTVIASDIVDSVSTFMNTTLLLSSLKPIETIAAMGLPLGYTMVGLGTISRTVQILKSKHLDRLIEQKIASGNDFSKEEIIDFLETTMGITTELKALRSLPSDQRTETQRELLQRTEERNRSALLKAAPGIVIEELENLLMKLGENDEKTLSTEELNELLNQFQTIRKHMIKKREVDAIAITANLFSLTALALFTAGVATSTPFALLGISFSIRLGALYYQDHKLVEPYTKQ